MKYFLIALTLYGNVAVENKIGRIGLEDHTMAFSHNIKIMHVHKDSNAAKAGLKQGDIILWISDKDILGPIGTDVTLIIQRGNKVFTVTITRQSYKSVNKAYQD